MGILRDQLSPLFGDNPRQFDLVMINLVAALIGVFLAWGMPEARENLSIFHKILMVIIAWDTIGGIMANLTRSTTEYYARSSRAIRLWFYAMHAIHPLAILFFSPRGFHFPDGIIFFLFAWVYTVGSAFLVREIIPEDKKSSMAGLFIGAGIIIYTYFVKTPPAWEWFGYAFMVKLIICHALDHHGISHPPLDAEEEDE